MTRHLRISDEEFDELQRTGGPLVVVVDGREVVVQDAGAYRRMLALLDELDLAESGSLCTRRWQAMQGGEDPGISAEELLGDLRRRLGDTG